MEYILITLAMLIFGACVLALFIESEILRREVIYKKGCLKLIKTRGNKVVSRKVYKGWIADLIYKLFC